MIRHASVFGASASGIEAIGLSREFRGGPPAVAAVSLSIAGGEIYGLLGPNGAGKSTLVLMLTTLLRPSAGTAVVGGFDIVQRPRDVRRVMGATLQDVAVDPLLTGREHLALQAALQGLRRAASRRRADELLAQLALEEVADRRVRTYSGGMKRRLDLAMALVHSPSVLFLDEPSTGLDPASRSTVWAEVRHLALDLGVTILLTTHYLEEADALADRVGIIDQGHLIAEGSPDQLKHEMGRPLVEITPASRADTARLVHAVSALGTIAPGEHDRIVLQLRNGTEGLEPVNAILARERLAVSRLVLRPPTLEDVFLARTGRSFGGDQTGATKAET